MGILKDFIDIIDACCGMIAIFAGGLWAFYFFVLRRQRYPNATITQRIVCKKVSGNRKLIIVNADIVNVGDVLVQIQDIETRLQRVMPLASNLEEKVNAGEEIVDEGRIAVEWPLIAKLKNKYDSGRCEIEPNGSHRIQFDFVIKKNYESIRVYTFVRNEKKRGREIGWHAISFFDIP